MRTSQDRNGRALAVLALVLGSYVASCSATDGVTPPCPLKTGTGSIIIDGGVGGACPSITHFEIVPFSLPVGTDAQLTGDAIDSDSDHLLFSWTTTLGTVANAKAADTSFHCSAPGVATITLAVSDGSCVDKSNTSVDCVPPGCGDGVLDPGEGCDDGNVVGDDGCSAQCTVE